MITSVEASEIQLFEILLEHTFDNVYYDLHNTFLCESISYKNRDLELLFRHDNITTRFRLLLQSCDIAKSNIDFPNNSPLILDNFFRGRYLQDGEIYELRDGDTAYFYIDFCEEISIECFCKKIQIEITS